MRGKDMENSQKLPIRIKFAMAYGDFGKSTLNIRYSSLNEKARQGKV